MLKPLFAHSIFTREWSETGTSTQILFEGSWICGVNTRLSISAKALLTRWSVALGGLPENETSLLIKKLHEFVG